MEELKMTNPESNNPFSLATLTNNDTVIALAGNPNTGKSTIFNALTGLRQHTGNWPGKTVTNAQGHYSHQGESFLLVDLPGTYSLLANSVDEQVARDFICFGKPAATIVVTDATNLERNLNLALQVMEISDNVIISVNLLDEAARKGIKVNLAKLSAELGIPVVGTIARNKKGLNELKEAVFQVINKKIISHPLRISYSDEVERLVATLTPQVEKILQGELNARWVAIRLIEGDETIINSIEQFLLNKELILEGEMILCH